MISRTASLALPAPLRTWPSAFSILPSASRSRSRVIWPAFSLIVPVAFFRPPSIRCLSIVVLQTFVCVQTQQASTAPGSETEFRSFSANRQSREAEHQRNPLRYFSAAIIAAFTRALGGGYFLLHGLHVIAWQRERKRRPDMAATARQKKKVEK